MAVSIKSHPTTSGRAPFLPARAPAAWGLRSHGPRRRPAPASALPELAGAVDVALGAAASLLQHAPLAYEPVAAPCSLMNCGDAIYRSTLDPVLRKEVGGPSWQVFALAAAAALYLFATPGVLPGFFDYYVFSRLQQQRQRAIDLGDLKLGKKLGSGAFGQVYKAQLAPEAPGAGATPVIVKQAKEFGEAEVWMNERMMRASPLAGAAFIGAFEGGAGAEGAPRRRRPVGVAALGGLFGGKKAPAADADAREDPEVWLVWRDEGDFTLWDLMQAKREPGFPYNLEPLLFGRELRLPRGKARRLVVLKVAMRQLLEDLRDCHATGIVHRDFKPQNIIASAASQRLKLIDFGAAADLRLGINYVPNEYLLDPRYAPPQQYIMSRSTPRPPPKPVAALLSPVLWAMEAPDKFDMYSVGITLLQLAFPALRTDNALISFNKKLRDLGWDLNAWRNSEALSKRNGQWPKELEEGFEVLDADDGAGWDLACKLVTYKPGDRLTASGALSHPWLASAPAEAPGTSGSALLRASEIAERLSASVGTAIKSTANSVGSTGGGITRSIEELLPADLVQEAITASNKGALTEAFLLQEFGNEAAAPAPPRDARQTIAWWQGRKAEMARRKASSGNGGSSGAASPSSSRTPGGSKVVVVAPRGASPGAAAAAAGAKPIGVSGPAGGARVAARRGRPMTVDDDDEEPMGSGTGPGAGAPSGAPDGSASGDEGGAGAGGSGAGAASRVKDLLSVFSRR